VTPASRPWLWALVAAPAALATTLAVLAPGPSLVVALALAAAAGLVRRYGALRGVFYLFVGTLPFREPLGFDVAGTKTIYPTDFLIYGLVAAVLREHGIRRLWRRSPVFRIGTVILALSVLGVYGSPRPFWELTAIQRTVGELATLYVARCLVRSGAEARTVLLAYVAGMVPAILYGFHQSTIPVDASTFPRWAEVPLAYDAGGRARVRIFSTFDHALHLSQALAMTVGLAVGLLGVVRGHLRRLALVATACAAAVCNQYTYSVSGVLGTGAAAFAGLLTGRSRRWLPAFPLLFAAWIVLTPDALRVRLTELAHGTSATALARIITYRQGLRALIEHPIRGVGWGGIGDLTQGAYQIARSEMVPTGPENYFLFRMVALGIPGLFLYGALPFLLLRGCRRPGGRAAEAARAWPRAAVLGAAAGYWVQAMFMPSGSYPNNYVLWLLLGLAESMREAALAPEGVPVPPAASYSRRIRSATSR
jgi:O-antigen ligase